MNNPVLGEFIGTLLLIIMGQGVVANVVLQKTKGHNSGLLVIAFGWAMAVFLGVFVCTTMGGNGHLNPAVTIAMATLGKLDWSQVFSYIAAQMSGAILGSIIAWGAYKQHFEATSDADSKLAVFSTSPAIRNSIFNLLTEAIATFLLIFGALLMSKPTDALGTLNALPVAFLVLGIGLSLGGPTGYAINPARDLGPRIAHFLLPIPGKRNSDWAYAWVPVVGPILGGLIAAFTYQSL